MTHLELLTIFDYNLHPNKQDLFELLVKAIQHAIDKDFDLYMTYDKSCEPLCRSIPRNMLTNAIIDLTHKQPISDYSSYETKSPDFYRNYYNDVWKSILLHVRDNLSTLIAKVEKYNMVGDTAFPNDANFVGAIIKAADIGLHYDHLT